MGWAQDREVIKFVKSEEPPIWRSDLCPSINAETQIPPLGTASGRATAYAGDSIRRCSFTA